MPTPIENSFGEGDCFFCGPNNPSGLKLVFFHDEASGETFTEYTPTPELCGQGEVFHGGLQMGLLDECMWWAGFAATGVKAAVTARASFRFLRPARIGDRLKAVCWVKSHEGDAIHLRGHILNSNGEKCTAVKGEFRVVDEARYAAALKDGSATD